MRVRVPLSLLGVALVGCVTAAALVTVPAPAQAAQRVVLGEVFTGPS